MNTENKLKELESRLAVLETDRQNLLLEIRTLRDHNNVASIPKTLPPLLGKPTLVNTSLSSDEKISLFLKLFRCRENVFPKRWESNETGKQGYSPVCGNEWVNPLCKKPKIKCADCNHQKFSSLNDLAVEAHLKGLSTIGTYAIREDDTCIFLASDFDERLWRRCVSL